MAVGFSIFENNIQQLCHFLRMNRKKVPLYQLNILFFVFACLFCGSVTAQNYNDSLLDGAWSGNAEKVQRAILHKADLNARLSDGATALHYACGGNYQQIVRILISAGADVNAKDNIDRTPLHISALNGNDSIGELLIVNGAGLKSRNSDGLTPLMVAVSNGNYYFSDMCLYYGDDIRQLSIDSSGLCHMAVKSGNSALLQMLTDRGAEVNICDKSGRTPLAYAVMYNDTFCAGVLLRAGAEPQLSCSGENSKDLISLAVSYHCNETVAFLMSFPQIRKQSNLRRLRDDVIRLDNREMFLAFRKDSVPLSWKPIFQGVLFQPVIFINFRDHFCGFSFGTMEMKSKIGVEMGISTRLWKKRVLWDYEITGETLQLQEKRGFVYFGQYKAIRLWQKGFSGLQVEPGVQESYTWAWFDGMVARPWRGWNISPALDLTWFGRQWSVSLGGRILDFHNTLPGFYFSLSGGFVIPFKNQK